MNLPNLLTLSRIPILFIIAAILFGSWPGSATLAFLLFMGAGLTDWLDGYVARKRSQVSNFGKLMDALADKIMMVGMFIALLAIGLIPTWMLFLVLLVVAREFLITGMRLVAASNGLVLAAEKAGKQKTVTQILSIATLLFVPVLDRDLSRVLGRDLTSLAESLHLLGLLIFGIAVLLTLLSGVRYIAKYGFIFTKEESSEGDGQRKRPRPHSGAALPATPGSDAK